MKSAAKACFLIYALCEILLVIIKAIKDDHPGLSGIFSMVYILLKLEGVYLFLTLL